MATRRIVEQHPGLNITEVAARLPESREEVWQFIRSLRNAESNYPMVNRNLPPLGQGSARDTARKHLTEMLADGEVQRVGNRFYLKKPIESNELTKSINDLVSKGPHKDWSYPTAQGAAICRTIVDPEDRRHKLDSFFDDQVLRVAETVFYLDEILEHGIGTEDLKKEVYTPSTGTINMKLLRRGWRRYFGNTKLLALLLVFSPPKFLKFLGTPVGQDLAERMLSKYWNSIVTRGGQELSSNQRSAFHRKKVRDQLKKERMERQGLPQPKTEEGNVG